MTTFGSNTTVMATVLLYLALVVSRECEVLAKCILKERWRLSNQQL